MSIQESIEKIFPLQLQYSHSNTPAMQARGELIRNDVPKLFRTAAESGKIPNLSLIPDFFLKEVMAKVIENGNQLILKLSFWEKIGGLHKDLVVPKENLIKKTVHQNPWSKEVLRGVRAPGTGIPYVVLLGTMRFKGGKDFIAIYKRRPVSVYEFKSGEFKRWIVSE